MISDFVTQLDSAIGSMIGNRIYAQVVPINASFPCIKYQRISTNPFHTKDAADRSETVIRVWIYVKDTLGPDSPSKRAIEIADTLRTAMNGLIVDGIEYRVEDESDFFEEDQELFSTVCDVKVQSNYP